MTHPPNKQSRVLLAVTVVAMLLGVIGLCGSLFYVDHAWTVISGGYQGPDAGMALGILLVVVGPTVLLGFALSFLAKPVRWPLLLNGLALFFLLLWFVAVSVPAPKPSLQRYAKPEPAFVCGSAKPYPGDPGDRWDFELTVAARPPTVAGRAVRDGYEVFNVTPSSCTFDGTFRCVLGPTAPALWLQPTQQRDDGFQTGDPIPETNAATVSFRAQTHGAYSDVLPYARSCNPTEVARSLREQRDRFSTQLLLREWYTTLVGESDGDG